MTFTPPSSWLAQIENAHTTAEILRIVRDYLASLGAEEAAQLPTGISQEAVQAPGDVQEWAVMLAHSDLRGGPDTPAALHRAAVVLAAAASKMPKLAE